MITFQDFIEAKDVKGFIQQAIAEYKMTGLYQMAKTADLYDRQMNTTINEYVRKIYTLAGEPIEDFTASNNKIASNIFRRLNTQRCTYLLGNGVSFVNKKIEKVDGRQVTVDSTKDRLGKDFDTALKDAGYKALIHGVSFGFWNNDKLYVFNATEFVPLWDEYDGSLRAGIRFWRLHPEKPLIAILYEEDGYTKFKSVDRGSSEVLEVCEQKKPYKTKVAYTEIGGDSAVVGVETYSKLPIVPFWGSRLHQSTLVGMQQAIDSYDLIRSGFANDLTDCSEIYWLLENCGGMDDKDLARFRDRLKINHIVEVDGDSGAKATPYTQEVPYQARKQYLDDIRAGIYEDFGALDVHTISAGATNDHIEAGYQPLDENADDFEYQAIEFIRQILALIGIDDMPIFLRNRISNQKEQTDMVLASANYLDDETVLKHLPFINVDEVAEIMARKDEESYGTIEGLGSQADEQEA